MSRLRKSERLWLGLCESCVVIDESWEKYLEDSGEWELKLMGWGVNEEMWKGWSEMGSMGERRFWREMGGFEKGRLFGKCSGEEVKSVLFVEDGEWMKEEELKEVGFSVK